MALSGTYSVHAITVTATAALTGERFATTLGAVPAAGAGNVGVARYDGAIGDDVTVDLNGQVNCTAGAAIAAGALVEVGTAGKAITKASGIAVGRALTAASADGSRFSMILTPGV